MCELQVTIRGLSCELGERVGELQRLDKLYRELQTQQVRTEDFERSCSYDTTSKYVGHSGGETGGRQDCQAGIHRPGGIAHQEEARRHREDLHYY